MEEQLFDKRGFGVIKTDFGEIYNKALMKGKKIAIVKNRISTEKKLKSYFEKLMERPTSITDFQNKTVYDTEDVLDFFLKLHKKIYEIKPSTREETNSNEIYIKKEILFANVIFLEIKTHLYSSMEQLILMYFYMLNIGMRLPEFYVLVDYQTDIFNFIETDIFRGDASKIPNFLPPKQQIELENFQDSMYISSHLLLKTQFVVSEIDLHSKILAPILTFGNFRIFENYSDYSKAEPPKSFSIVTIVKFKSLDEILNLKEKIEPDWIIIDSRIKLQTSIHYGGNVHFPKRINNDYLVDKLVKIKNKISNENCRFSFHFSKDIVQDDSVSRAVFEKNPIFDYVRFEKNGVNLLTLYANYFPVNNSVNFISVLKSEIETLKQIGYRSSKNTDPSIILKNRQLEKLKMSGIAGAKKEQEVKELEEQIAEEMKLIDFSLVSDIHPVMVAIINRWMVTKTSTGKSLPRFPILLFTAVTTTFNKKIIEVREHGQIERASNISEGSRFGIEMQDYLDKMEKEGKAVFPSGGITSDRLKKLIDHYGISPNEIGIFDLNAFTRELVKIIKTYFSSMILRKKGHSNYRGSYNEQLNWWISADSGPDKIFPIIVYTSKLNKNISLYIPIEDT